MFLIKCKFLPYEADAKSISYKLHVINKPSLLYYVNAYKLRYLPYLRTAIKSPYAPRGALN